MVLPDKISINSNTLKPLSRCTWSFAYVSSDSDYTGIANRLREEGLFVMGMGKSHTPEAFVKACENFIYTEILTQQPTNISKIVPKELPKPSLQKNVKATTLINKVTKEPFDITLMDNAFEMVVDDTTGLALAAQLAGAIRKIDSTFDPRNYGYNSLRKFLEALKQNYEIVVHDDKTTISIRKKE
jgi:hypothetical protein